MSRSDRPSARNRSGGGGGHHERQAQNRLSGDLFPAVHQRAVRRPAVLGMHVHRIAQRRQRRISREPGSEPRRGAQAGPRVRRCRPEWRQLVEPHAHGDAGALQQAHAPRGAASTPRSRATRLGLGPGRGGHLRSVSKPLPTPQPELQEGPPDHADRLGRQGVVDPRPHGEGRPRLRRRADPVEPSSNRPGGAANSSGSPRACSASRPT